MKNVILKDQNISFSPQGSFKSIPQRHTITNFKSKQI